MLGAKEIKIELRDNYVEIWDGFCTIPAEREDLWQYLVWSIIVSLSCFLTTLAAQFLLIGNLASGFLLSGEFVPILKLSGTQN